MAFHRSVAYAELSSDVMVSGTFGDQNCNRLLSLGQNGLPRLRGLRRESSAWRAERIGGHMGGHRKGIFWFCMQRGIEHRGLHLSFLGSRRVVTSGCLVGLFGSGLFAVQPRWVGKRERQVVETTVTGRSRTTLAAVLAAKRKTKHHPIRSTQRCGEPLLGKR